LKTIDSLKPILKKIYGDEKGATAFNRLAPLIKAGCQKHTDSEFFFSERDTILITYGDTITDGLHFPFKTLLQFAERFFKNIFSTIHILPFFPFSSDDGFSVIDFFAVDPLLGSWEDIRELNTDFELMFDFVLNHISSKSQWFQNYLNETESEKELAIEAAPSDDLLKVVRPRALPLLTKFTKQSGKADLVWTTFSEDQIDLNYNSLDVLEKMVRVLLHYVGHGAKILRFDAIAYLWKQIGTSCIHVPQTHAVVRFLRELLAGTAPEVLLLTETNVPHAENISYFGDGAEAHLVYQFSLPPLVLDAWLNSDAGPLVRWLAGLAPNSGTAKAGVAGAVAGRSPAAERRPADARVADPTAAADHPARAGLRGSDRVGLPVGVVVPGPVRAPLPDVAEHVVQAPGVRAFLAYWMGAGLGVRILLSRPTRRGVAVREPELDAAVPAIPGDRIEGRRVVLTKDLDRARVERRFGAGAAGVLPLGLGRQNQVQARDTGVDAFEKPLHMVPAHPLHGAIRTLKPARILPHHRLPERLGARRIHEPKALGDLDDVLRPFAVPPSRLVLR